MVTVAIIGLGNRGRIYAHNFNAQGAKIAAICEKNPGMLKYIREKYGIPEDKAFLNEKDFFAAGKLADALVVATQDRDHYGHAMAGMDLGYHILCEKPVSPFLGQCVELKETAEKKGLKMVICHVLRYAPYYDRIKEIIDSGAIGEITNINQTENVGYDLDLIYYYTGKPCERVYSIGERREFLPENAPEGATARCMDGCPHRKTCPYEVSKLYYKVTTKTIPWLIGHTKVVTGKGNPKLKDIKEALRTNQYGRCVYKCDNDVMENQVVSCKMGNVNATLTMTAQSNFCYRRTHICGTKGEILGTDKNGYFTLKVFGERSKKVRVKKKIGHLGGDSGIVSDFIKLMETGEITPRLSLMSETIMSHKMAFAAEESRKTGKAVTIE